MSGDRTSLWVLAGLAGVVALGAFVWSRKKKQEGDDAGEQTPLDAKCEALRLAGAGEAAIRACQALAQGGSLSDACEALRLAGASDAAIAACKGGVQLGKDILEVGDAILDEIITGQKTDLDAVNTKLNGAIVASDPLKLKAFFEAQQHIAYAFSGYNQAPIFHGTIRYVPPQYQNGCIPLEGANLSSDIGNHRCVKGTKTYTRHSDISRKKTLTGSYAVADPLKRAYTGLWEFEAPPDLVEQDPYKVGWRLLVTDPLTHPHYWQGNHNFKDKIQPFPLQVKEGETAWWVAGQPYVGPRGLIPRVIWSTATGRKAIQEVRWVVVGAEPEAVPPPPMNNQPPADAGPPVSVPPREFVWVPTPPPAPTAPGYWERAKRTSTT